MKQLLTAERLRELLAYDAQTGVFTWRARTSIRTTVGCVAGSLGKWGYSYIGIDGRKYRSHRLAWLHVHGRWPAEDIDHRNGERADNRLANLREASRSQNLANSCLRSDNRIGLKGVSRNGNRWKAEVQFNSRRIHLGTFSTPVEAHAAYVAAAAKHHGEFSRAS